MEQQQIDAYKHLAASVMAQAMSDLRNKGERQPALRFLTSPDFAKERGLWLAWLGLDDDGFQKLIRQNEFQGFGNTLNLTPPQY